MAVKSWLARWRSPGGVLAVLTALCLFPTALPVFATGYYGVGDFGDCPYAGQSSTCDISISNNGFSLFLNITPSSGGSCTIQSDQVSVSTYDPNGYTLTLGNQATNTSLLATNGSGNTVPASSGTPGSPVALLNLWGYRVDGWSGFGSGPTSPVTNGSYSSSVLFAGAKASNLTADSIAQTSTLNTSPVSTTVWYGICANLTLNAQNGSYTSTVQYTATAN